MISISLSENQIAFEQLSRENANPQFSGLITQIKGDSSHCSTVLLLGILLVAHYCFKLLLV